ncbi:hypothetical protein VPDG_00077 [Vibrio phage henriette 12B8]|uniref:hypothetical protein n=1 Tax=Vibrio phage henriette 12B8 TaxID=573174 RepID=UPI0002C10941|nr:hypothetical protein VPDG_00077 [Vibrio phage henriette 12B8]AGG58238.1 hypothetical protein VPDG_00077 [Vibrio phage henriette 12B8]
MMATVVNLNKEEYDVYIGRAGYGLDGYYGNPFSIHATDPLFKVNSRTEAIAKHKDYAIRKFNVDAEFRARVIQLYGKRLGCFCHPRGCHGDILAELSNGWNSPLFGRTT